MGGLGPVACQGFLVGGTSVCVLVGGAGSLLSRGQEVSSSDFQGVYGFVVALGSMLFNIQDCILILL